MATFRYIGCHQPNPATGNYSVIVPTTASGRTSITHSLADFTVPDDEVTIASLEYHIDAWTGEYDFMRTS